MGENVFLRKEELESVEPIWEEETLTSFARGARVLGVALATAVDARPVHRARDRAADDKSSG